MKRQSLSGNKHRILSVFLGVARLSILLIGEAFAGEISVVKKSILAVRVDSPPVIDGKLEELCWQRAHPTTGFVQREPDAGEAAREQTTVRVLYDDENLYFGIECLDSEGGKIEGRLVTRDDKLFPGDFICLLLDTYYDHQNGYVFWTNPYGIQADAYSQNDGLSVDRGWDGVWRSAGKTTPRGWTAEMAIPFKTLRFSGKDEEVWGVNIQRYRKMGREESNWAPISRDDASALKPSKAGYLVGLENLRHGLHLELLPYVTGQRGQDRPNTGRWGRDFGIDVKYGMATNFALDLTVNPDFAHVEADEDRINLTRFELYLPEKRPFFLEGKRLLTPMNLFYTRRINNPDFGAKLIGKTGGYSFGILTAVDEEADGTNPVYSVLRMRRDLFQKSSIGIIGVGKQDGNDYSRTLGMDLGLRLADHYVLDANLAKTFNPGLNGESWRKSVDFAYSSEKIGFHSMFSQMDPDFNIDQIGYAPHDPHVGKKEMVVELHPKIYIRRFGIYTLTPRPFVRIERHTDGNENSKWAVADLLFHLEDRSSVAWLVHQRKYVVYKGEEYRGDLFSVGFNMSGEKSVYGGMHFMHEDRYDFGDDYFGSVRHLSCNIHFRPRDNLSLDFDVSNYWEYFPSGDFDEFKQVDHFRVTYLPTRDFFLRVFLQVNPTTDIHSLNALLGYTYRPMSRFNLAYNESREHVSGNLKMINRIVFLKFSYLWNL